MKQMNLSKQLAETAKKRPDKTAYIFQEKETTYRGLEGSVQKFADSLQKMGIQKGDHIALVTGNSPYYVIGLYGALRIGAAVLPINPLYTSQEMSYILDNGDVKAVITMDVLLEKFASPDGELSGVDHYIVCESGQEAQIESGLPENKLQSFTQLVENGSLEGQTPKLHNDDLAVILYTSGTTGKPKGAMLTHKNLYSNAKDVADYLTINGDDRMIAALPMFHVFCLTVCLNAPLMNGGTVLIMPKFSPQELFEMTARQQATVFAGVPTMYNYLLQSGKNRKSD